MAAGKYIVIEGPATSSGWIQTYGMGGHAITATSGTNYTNQDFGNLKEVAETGGQNIGYWTGCNGQLTMFPEAPLSMRIAVLPLLATAVPV